MLPRTSSTLTALVCAALLQSGAWAAEPPAMIAGTGEASIHIVANKIRIQLQVEAHGKTTELALQRLKTRREAVAENLWRAGGREAVAQLRRPKRQQDCANQRTGLRSSHALPCTDAE